MTRNSWSISKLENRAKKLWKSRNYIVVRQNHLVIQIGRSSALTKPLVRWCSWHWRTNSASTSSISRSTTGCRTGKSRTTDWFLSPLFDKQSRSSRKLKGPTNCILTQPNWNCWATMRSTRMLWELAESLLDKGSGRLGERKADRTRKRRLAKSWSTSRWWSQSKTPSKQLRTPLSAISKLSRSTKVFQDTTSDSSADMSSTQPLDWVYCLTMIICQWPRACRPLNSWTRPPSSPWSSLSRKWTMTSSQHCATLRPQTTWPQKYNQLTWIPRPPSSSTFSGRMRSIYMIEFSPMSKMILSCRSPSFDASFAQSLASRVMSLLAHLIWKTTLIQINLMTRYLNQLITI